MSQTPPRASQEPLPDNLFSSPRPHDASSSPAPMQLTPRSKIKALLADSDDESDKENQGSGPNYSRPGKVETPTITQQDRQTSRSGSRGLTLNGGSEDEIAARIPRGRVAGKMQAQVEDSSRSENASRPEESAYERVKRQILAASKQEATAQQAAHPEEDEQEPIDHVGSDDSQSQPEGPQRSPTTRPDIDDEDVLRRSATTRERSMLANLFDDDDDEEAPASSASSRHSSPGLFVSPQKSPMQQVESLRESTAENADTSKPKNRLQELIERRRKEWQAKESAAAAQESDSQSDSAVDARNQPMKPKTTKKAPKKQKTQVLEVESEGDSDKEEGKKLTQQSRPTRKASKKAQEEMKRETQRMSRNMQLTHEARTKTKFTTQDFLAKFNFRGAAAKSEPVLEKDSSSSAPVTSDAEPSRDFETPPSSPPSMHSQSAKASPSTASKALQPTVSDTLKPCETIIEAEKETTEDIAVAPVSIEPTNPVAEEPAPKRASLRKFEKSVKKPRSTSDSDDELEIVGKDTVPSRLAVFDRIPEAKKRESNSLHTLRALAMLHDHEKPKRKAAKSMNPLEMRALLQKKARQQALMEREEKIQALAARGIVVQTAEEKEHDQMQLDNMLEKARQDADELAKKEKEEAKKAGKEDEGDHLPDSDDEDEEWQESEEEAADLSGSDVENEALDADDENEDDDDEDELAKDDSNGLFDNEAEEGDDEADEEDDAAENNANDDEDEELNHNQVTRRQSRKTFVVADDDDEDSLSTTAQEQDDKHFQPPSTTAAAFGFKQKSTSPIGLSQVFAGTMADSQSQEDNASKSADAQEQEPQTPAKAAFGFTRPNAKPFGLSQVFQSTMGESPTQGGSTVLQSAERNDPLAFLRHQTPSKMVNFPSTLMDESQGFLVEDSQQEHVQSPIDAQNSAFFQFDSQSQATFQETGSEIPEATQDAGFQSTYSQLGMPASYSTVATEPLEQAPEQAPSPVKQKGRLQRRNANNDTIQAHSENEADSNAEYSADEEASPTKPNNPNAFEILRKSSKNPHPPPDAYNKKTSEAKRMVEEQAEESEDEYAGLGGASDDDSDASELDEEAKKMIDDEGKEKVNEREIAAFYADKERAEDEKRMQKLYTDVINGGLRRKRGAADLWESDDEDEAAKRRRAAKQRHEAKMRKALLADEKIGKIAENPKQAAFLAAIADRGEGEEGDGGFLDDFAVEESQSQSQERVADSQEPLQPTAANAPTKRKHSAIIDEVSSSNQENRPPPNLRRGASRFTKPTSLADIRNTLSEIIGAKESQQQLPEDGDESQEDDRDNELDEIMQASDRDSDNDASEDRIANSQTESARPPTHIHPRRTNLSASASRSAIIDRMALKRSGSSSASASRENSAAGSSNAGKLAFHAPAAKGGSSSGFKVPSLLRRATTNLSTSSESGSTSSSAVNGGGAAAERAKIKDGVRMGGTAKSSVNYYVREQERRTKIEQLEKERVEGRQRVGRLRKGQASGEKGLKKVAGGGVFG